MKKTKCAIKDYTVNDLPNTRKEVFVECFREQFSLLFKLGLLCAVLLLPTLICIVLKDGYLWNVFQSTEKVPQTEQLALYGTVNNVFGIFEGITFILFSVLFSGVLQIIRQIIWREPVFFWDDYKDGIKSNGKKFLLVSILVVIPVYLMNWVAQTSYITWMQGIMVAVILPLAIWILLQSLYYQLDFKNSLKNAIIFYIQTFFVTILLLVVMILPFYLSLQLIGTMYIRYLVFIGLSVVCVVPISMVWLIYASHIFDEFINKENYPSSYRKGMRKL